MRRRAVDSVKAARFDGFDHSTADGELDMPREETFGGIEFVWVEPGRFTMGSPEDEPEHEDREQQHEVTLTQGFWLGKHPVTQAQWEGVMGANPSNIRGDALPVEHVSWDDCLAMIAKLNNADEAGFRLPTEAEWEYACRAGTTTPFSFGGTISTDQANYNGSFTYADGAKGSYRRRTTEVGSFAPNAWGFHDMHGNVWEWCSDWYDIDYYKESPEADPQGPSDGSTRVLRGGSWHLSPRLCRSAFRGRFVPTDPILNNGVRLGRSLIDK